MPRKTSFCNAALLRSDIKRYWPLLFLYVAVWVVILPMQILSASRECDGVAEGIMTVLQLRQHNVIIQSIPASVVMSLLFGCFAAMAVWSYLMSGRTVGLMHALPVTRTQAFFSHVLSALGALTAGNVLIFLLTALCSAGFSYVDWAALGTWLLLTELMALFFFALGSLCAMVTGWLLAVPVLYGAMNVIALLLYAVISTMTQMFYFGYSNSDIPEFITWLTPVGRIWDAVANGGAQPIEVQFREPIGTQSYQRVQLPASAFSTCIIYAAVGIALLALVWWLETAAMVLVLAAVTVCVKLDITGYQHRVPDAEDVTSVRFSASYADFTADDPAAVESVISLHRAILEQYDETGERLENQTYLDTEGGPITRYVRVDYQLRNGTSLCREWRVSIVNGSDIHRLLTQLVSRTDCRESLMGLDVLRKYGGVSNVAGGYVTQYETGAFADLTRQQAQDLVSHALADAANSRAPIDPLRDDMYSSTNLDIEIRLNTDKGNVSFSLNVPDFAVETKAFLDALEFEEPVDGTYDSPEKCYDDELYEDEYGCSTKAVGQVLYD